MLIIIEEIAPLFDIKNTPTNHKRIRGNILFSILPLISTLKLRTYPPHTRRVIIYPVDTTHLQVILLFHAEVVLYEKDISEVG